MNPRRQNMRLQLNEVAKRTVYTQPITNHEKKNHNKHLRPSLCTLATEITDRRYDLTCKERGGKRLGRHRCCLAARGTLDHFPFFPSTSLGCEHTCSVFGWLSLWGMEVRQCHYPSFFGHTSCSADTCVKNPRPFPLTPTSTHIHTGMTKLSSVTYPA